MAQFTKNSLKSFIKESVREVILEKKIKEQTETPENTDSEMLCKGIRKVFKSVFPDSYMRCSFSANISPSVFVAYALGKEKSEFENGIFENDPIATKITILGFDKEGNINVPQFVAKGSTGGGVYLKSRTTVKVWRNFKASTVESAISRFENHFKKLAATLEANEENLQKLPFKLSDKI